MLSKLLLVAATMLLVACEPCNSCKTHREQVVDNPMKYYRVSKLFETDGCIVYEYNNKGHWKEFIKCNSGVTQNESL